MQRTILQIYTLSGKEPGSRRPKIHFLIEKGKNCTNKSDFSGVKIPCTLLQTVIRLRDTDLPRETASQSCIYSAPCLRFRHLKVFSGHFSKPGLGKRSEDRYRIRTRKHTLPVLFNFITSLNINILCGLLCRKVNLKRLFILY